MATKKTNRTATTTAASNATEVSDVHNVDQLEKAPRRKGEPVTTRADVLAAIDHLGLDPANFGLSEYTYPDGNTRWGGAGIVTLSISFCLRYLVGNLGNREVNWAHALLLASFMRNSASNPERWEPLVSALNYAIDPETKQGINADGQHRAIAYILAFGTRRDIQHLQHILECNYQRYTMGIELDSSLFYLHQAEHYGDNPSEPLIWPMAGDGSDVDDDASVPFDEYLDFYASIDPEANLYDEPALAKWTVYDHHAAESVPTAPVFVLSVGADPEAKRYADVDAAKRTAADMLTMDKEVGNSMARNSVNPKWAVTVMKQAWRRLRPIQSTGSDDQKKLGSLKGGGRGIGDKLMPDLFKLWESQLILTNEIMQETKTAVWIAANGDRLEKAVKVHAENQATPVKRLPEKDPKTGKFVVEGYCPSDVAITNIVFWGVLGGMKKAELMQVVTCIKFGVTLSKDGVYEKCNCFGLVKDKLRSLAAEKLSMHDDTLVCSLIASARAMLAGDAKHPRGVIVDDPTSLAGRWDSNPDKGGLPAGFLQRLRGVDVGSGRGSAKRKAKAAKATA